MTRKSSPLTDLLLIIVLPSIILMKFSGADELGARGALVVALAFPVALGLYELVRFRITNYIALLGLISVLLTGGIRKTFLDQGLTLTTAHEEPVYTGGANDDEATLFPGRTIVGLDKTLGQRARFSLRLPDRNSPPVKAEQTKAARPFGHRGSPAIRAPDRGIPAPHR